MSRIEIVWRRFARCRIEHAIQRQIYVAEGQVTKAIEWCAALCGQTGSDFGPTSFIHYRRCEDCIARAKDFE